jgi:hypothetical protein
MPAFDLESLLFAFVAAGRAGRHCPPNHAAPGVN